MKYLYALILILIPAVCHAAWSEKYVDAAAGGGGDGSSGTPWTLAEAITNATAGDRVNIKAGTYANTTTSRTFANDGTTTAPIWWRGYASTIGDLDSGGAGSRPQITFTTGVCTLSGDYATWSNVDFIGTSNTSSLATTTSAVYGRFVRCKFESQNANASAYAVTSGSNVPTYVQCTFIASSTATRVVDRGGKFFGCYINGGVDGINAGTNALDCFSSVFNGQSEDCIEGAWTTGLFRIYGNSFNDPGEDGVQLTAAVTSESLIMNNVFSSCAYGINNSSGGNLATIQLGYNLFYNSGTADTNGFGDAVQLGNQSDSADPFVNAGTLDFTLKATSNGVSNGLPGPFLNGTIVDNSDIGAIQPERSAGGSVALDPIILSQ